MRILEVTDNHLTLEIDQANIDALTNARIFTSLVGPQRLVPGDRLIFAPNAVVEPYTSFLGGGIFNPMGSYSYTHSALPAHMKVGRFCSISTWLSVPSPRHRYEGLTSSSINYDHHLNMFSAAFADEGISWDISENPQKQDPCIGDDVWIGHNVMIMPGVSIGTGSIIAAGSVVTSDVPAMEIWGGNPARRIKARFGPGIVRDLLATRWWMGSLKQLSGKPRHDVAAFIKACEKDPIVPVRPVAPQLRTILGVDCDAGRTAAPPSIIDMRPLASAA